MYITFCIVGTVLIYTEGAFEYTDSIVGTLILVISYLIVGLVLHLFVKKNKKFIDDMVKK